MKVLLVILICVAGIVACNQTEWWQRQEVEMALRDAEQSKPVVISKSDDGCSVYRFKAGGDWRYFTRCGSDKVTTERDYTVQCGKVRCTKTETIETIGEEQESRP